MADHVEQLLVAMSMQFKIVYTSHMGDEDTAKEDIIRLYRVLLATLLSVCTMYNIHKLLKPEQKYCTDKTFRGAVR